MMTAVEPAHEGYRLSPQQEAVYLQEGAESRAERRVQSVSKIAPRMLAARMETLVAGHEILRTKYAVVPGLRMPVQVVNPVGPVSVDEKPLGITVLRAGQLSVEHSVTQLGTLLVLGLPRLSVDRVSWSTLTDLLLDERVDHTVAVSTEDDVLQYADVAAWLCEELEGAGPAGSTGPVQAPEGIAMPSAALPFLIAPGLRDEEAPPEMVTTTIDGPVLDRLRVVAHDLAVSESALLLAAWRSLHVRYTCSGDAQVVVVTEGRSAPGLKGVLGLLERPVAVHLATELEAPFAQAVKAAADALSEAAADECHCDPRAVAHLGKNGGAGPAVSFRYRKDPWATVTELGVLARAETPGTVHLDCVEGPETLFLTFVGTGALVAKADLVPFAEAFGVLLADALADSGRTIGLLRLYAQYVDAVRQHVQHQAVLYRFLEQAERRPDSPAVRCGDEMVTYRELARRAQAVGALLRDHGVQTGCYVPVLTPASANTLAAMLGVWLAEAAFVPIDPAWPQERIEAITSQVAATLVLVPGAASGHPLSGTVVPLPVHHDLPTARVPTAVRAQGAAYVIFTSGTAGTPKGVVIGHEQLGHYVASVLERLGLAEDTSFAAVSTLAADLSYTAVFPMLANGGCVNLVDVDTATDPEALAGWFRANPVSAMKLVPSHLSALLAEADDPRALLPGTALVLGGEALPPSLLDQVRELAPQLRVYNHYGPTETTIGASCLELSAPIDNRCASVPVGVGLGESALTVVDEEGKPLPPWCPGEVLITGPGVGLGYLAVPDDGKSGFAARKSVRHYRSGDLGRRVPGLGVEITGRSDDQIKIRGNRLQISEIESLLNGQPSVAAGAVVARTDAVGLVSHLDAYVVPGDGTGGASWVKGLRTVLGRALPVTLVPTGWEVLDRLPLTRNGKLDRKALPPIKSSRTQAGPPRDSIEQRLVILWSEVLGVDGLAPEDDFFDLGGHSLHAIKLISRINKAFSCRLPMSAVFHARTVAAMAGILRGSNLQDSNLVPLRRAKSGPAVFCFHPGGGSTLSYWEFARHLPAGLSVHGVESYGLHGRPPHESIDTMAEDYAAAIVASSDGPPVLVGWCFGGLVARETAQALRRAGHAVTMLVLIDCPAPGFDDQDDEALHEAQLLTESTLISRFAGRVAPQPSPQEGAAHSTMSEELLLKAMQSSGHLPSTPGEDEIHTILGVYTANMTAWEQHFARHAPQDPIDYPVLLIRAEPSAPAPDQDRTWGWRSLIGPGLSFASVLADHHSVMRSPAVVAVTDVVTQAVAAG